MTQQGKPHIVVVGAGFGGLWTARGLCRADARLTVIDRSNHHVFQPLLYQVATAGLSSVSISAPIREVLRSQDNTTVLMGEVRRIDVEARAVEVGSQRLGYDYLVVATGATHAYFGRDEWARHAPGLKSVGDALDIRRRVLSAYEAAEREADSASRGPWLTFVVVGAGPTGVELAGALSEIARHTLARDFRNFDPRSTRVVLVEASDRVLPTFSPASSGKARAYLEKLGVEVRTSTRVTDVDAAGVMLGDERLESRTVLWAAGVRASGLTSDLPGERDGAGRLWVEPDLTLPGHPEVFVIGDAAAVRLDEGTVPGVAPAAIQMGRHTARNLHRRLDGAPAEPFRYVDKGMLATVGRSAAVAEVFGTRMSGLAAWLLWLVVHVFFLIGFRNRIAVMMEWAWAYVTMKRSARVIFEPPGRLPPVRSSEG